MTIDCNGYWINYSTGGSTGTYGIHTNQFNTTVKIVILLMVILPHQINLEMVFILVLQIMAQSLIIMLV